MTSSSAFARLRAMSIAAFAAGVLVCGAQGATPPTYGGITLLAPADGASFDTDQTITFTWNNLDYRLDQVTQEQFLLNGQATYLSCPAGGPCPQSATGGPFSPGTYTWQVTWYDPALGRALDSETRSFSVVSAPPPPPPPPSTSPADTRSPLAKALPSKGRRRGLAKLVVGTFDDSGWVRLTIQIRRLAKVVGTVRTGFKRAGPTGSVFFIPWRVPPSAPSRLRFCARAYDRAGNTSKPTCAALVLTG